MSIHLMASGGETIHSSPAIHHKLNQPGLGKLQLRFLTQIPAEASISDHDVELLHKAHHANPFSVLGVHPCLSTDKKTSYIVIRGWVKDASTMDFVFDSRSSFDLVDTSKSFPMKRRAAWLFECAFEVQHEYILTSQDCWRLHYHYQVTYESSPNESFLRRDAFNFGLLLPAYDLGLFQSGSCWHVDDLMGSHMTTIDGIRGCRFAVWAPKAKFVSVVGSFNQWDGRAHPMRKRLEFGVWELFIPAELAHECVTYSYRIHTPAGHDTIKIDPFAQEMEEAPSHGCRVSACDDAFKTDHEKFQWTDHEFIKKRESLSHFDPATGRDLFLSPTDGSPLPPRERPTTVLSSPMSIFEVHIGSWMRGEGNRRLSYREIADRLVPYVKGLNFTHIELLPLSWHPFEGSWGYQTIGFYAPHAYHGDGDGIKYLVNKCHEAGIGVILDFVPAHFAKDAWGLYDFDGGPLFEYSDPKEAEHAGWGTRSFNFRQNEVRSFLLGAAYHWIRRYHIDGLRVDAVSAMIYKSYQREEGQWVANEFGGTGNVEAISLLKELTHVVHKTFPGVLTIAEESTDWKGISSLRRVDMEAEGQGAANLGFDLKWDLGWMNDTLKYLTYPPPMRQDMHHKLTFRGMYLNDERWVLPLSHDEVVSGKGSLLDKCGFAGTPFDERLRTMRALLGFQVGSPGRPLLFMGAEFSQGCEWKERQGSLDWHELEGDDHGAVSRRHQKLFTSDLFALYKNQPAFWKAADDAFMTFRWVDCENAGAGMIAFLRTDRCDPTNDILVVVNFSGRIHFHYQMGLPHAGSWTVLLNSDDWRYGGAMTGLGAGGAVIAAEGGVYGWDASVHMDIPANSVVMLKAPSTATWK